MEAISSFPDGSFGIELSIAPSFYLFILKPEMINKSFCLEERRNDDKYILCGIEKWD